MEDEKVPNFAQLENLARRNNQIEEVLKSLQEVRASLREIFIINSALREELGCEFLKSSSTTYNCQTPEELYLKDVLENTIGVISESSGLLGELQLYVMEAHGTDSKKSTTTTSRNTAGVKKIHSAKQPLAKQ